MTEEGVAPCYAATFRAEPSTVAKIRREVAEFAARCGFTDPDLFDVRIAVSEIVTNAVVHAYAGRTGDVRVRASFVRGDLLVVIADDGPGMAPRLKSPGLGLGLPTAAGAAADLRVVTPGRGGTEVHLTFRLASCDEPSAGVS